jgi:hypothetical protein
MVYREVPIRFADILGAVSVRYFRPTPQPPPPPVEPAKAAAK